VRRIGTGGVQTCEIYLDCHIHIKTLVSRRIQTEVVGCGCDNQDKDESVVVCYESIKRELKIRCINECRCDERLQSKTKELTRLGLVVGTSV
jgi:hypothetical protein